MKILLSWLQLSTVASFRALLLVFLKTNACRLTILRRECWVSPWPAPLSRRRDGVEAPMTEKTWYVFSDNCTPGSDSLVAHYLSGEARHLCKNANQSCWCARVILGLKKCVGKANIKRWRSTSWLILVLYQLQNVLFASLMSAVDHSYGARELRILSNAK